MVESFPVLRDAVPRYEDELGGDEFVCFCIVRDCVGI